MPSSIACAAWILLGYACVLVPAIAWGLMSVGFLAAGLLIMFLDPMSSNPRPRAPAPAASVPSGEPEAFYVFFALGAGCIVWLGAYIVTMITLSGVARALEEAQPADPDDSVSGADEPLDPSAGQDNAESET